MALTPQAEQQIIASDLPAPDKADVLTAMTVLAHLVSEPLARALYARRRELMIESPVLDWFREDIFKEGLELGEKRGLELGEQRGRQLGFHEGELQASRDNLLMILVTRFGDPAFSLREELQQIDDATYLGLLLQRVITVANLAEFRQLLK